MEDGILIARAFTTRAYQDYLDEGRIMAAGCLDCSKVILPPRAICPHCYGSRLEWTELSGLGTLETFTIIHVVPSWMRAEGYGRERPYAAGIVRLAEGPAVSAQIWGAEAPDPGRLKAGTPLRAKFLRRAEREGAVLAFELEPDRSNERLDPI